MNQLILASASPRRSALLHQIGLSFEVRVSHVTEKIPEHVALPDQVVMDLAEAKARQVAEKVYGNAVIIAADTVVVSAGQILGKPVSPAAAITMLASLSGKTHSVYTGLALYQPSTSLLRCDFSRTEVTFRHLTEKMIREYVATGEPMDKAGSYGIQGMGIVFVERIEGCYDNVVGLPLGKLVDMLTEFDVSIWHE